MLRYGLAVVLSAFLLFLVQPLIGKFILPWFGGVPAVWTTCILFFQVLLLSGYAYAHASICWLSPRAQMIVHLAILLAALLTLPVIPDETWKPSCTEMPVWRILALLFVTLGLPLFVLSATAPLLQAWYSRQHPSGSPYRLYAFSNGASLAGLISYPFIIEPAVRLKPQAWAWSAGFVLFALACGWCALQRRTGSPEQPVSQETLPKPAVSLGERAMWLAWSTCGSIMLLATSSELTQNIAAVPLLWVLPLALYLVSFVICFDNPRWYWRPLWYVAFPLAVMCVMSAPYLPLMVQVFLYCATLFISCMICHGELARLKPDRSRLTGYYLLVAVGGALGGVICSLIAPVAFNGLWEFPLGLAAVCVLLLQLTVRGLVARWNLNPKPIWISVLAMTVIVMAVVVVRLQGLHSTALANTRNFYGVLVVDEQTGEHGVVRNLLHGRVSHGLQFLDDEFRHTPVSYYGKSSGVGVAESVVRRQIGGERPQIRFGIVGLGAGVLAAYGCEGDDFRFYEVNPEVGRLAREYFFYLKDTPAEFEVVLGDARVSMQEERAHGESLQYDLLVLDAFNGDAVPLHLLTREAFALYDHHLATRGVLAVHISNQHLDMAPLIFGLARDSGKYAVLIEDRHKDGSRFRTSRWVLVVRDESFLKEPVVMQRATAVGDPSGWLCFTDDYSNLLQLVKKQHDSRPDGE